MRRLSIDIESYSGTDLASSGVYRYVEDPDFEILMIAYSWTDEDEVHQIDCMEEDANGNRRITYDPNFALFCEDLVNPKVIKTAFNAQFERTCFTKWLKMPMPPEQWVDTMVMARELGLPGHLAGAGEALGLDAKHLKDPQGKALIKYFSIPCKATKANGGRTRNLPGHDPAKWDLYKSYNRQDVVAEKAIHKALEPFVIPYSEWELWRLDQHMNDNGVRLDIPMVQKIVGYDNQRKEELLQEAKEITGLENPNSLAQLKKWVAETWKEQKGLTKDDVARILSEENPPDKVRRALEIRRALGKTSTAKYSAMLDAVCEDDRLRGILQFYGAGRTGRWAGRLVQTHNLARNTLPDLALAREIVAAGDFDELETLFGEPAFVFSELIRTAFIPSEGCRFIVSDFSAIEARVISWLADEEWRIKAFEDGKDIYCVTASQMYGVPVVKHGENGELRGRGKVAELACGYGGGVGAMRAMDTTGTIPEEKLQETVDKWRAANPSIVRLWWDVDSAIKKAIKRGESSESDKLAIWCASDRLFIRLPSGRNLTYMHPGLGTNKFGGESITFYGVGENHKWMKLESYGPTFVENICQAVARDCLAVVMQKVSSLGYKIVMHVHDEIIVDVPIEDTKAPEIVTRIMEEPIDWAPGLPLKGETYETPFYMKD